MSETEAGVAMDTISNAMSKVSRQRSALGAVQNRLEHTISKRVRFEIQIWQRKW